MMYEVISICVVYLLESKPKVTAIVMEVSGQIQCQTSTLSQGRAEVFVINMRSKQANGLYNSKHLRTTAQLDLSLGLIHQGPTSIDKNL